MIKGAAACLAGLGAAVVAGAWVEARAFHVVRHEVPLPVATGWRIMHLSDTHYQRGQRTKAAFLASLAGWRPDLVVVTGDMVADDTAFDEYLTALGGMLACPGVFVRGSNDYFGPTPVNPFKYLPGVPKQKPWRVGAPLNWQRLRDELLAVGWHDLDNSRVQVEVAGNLVELRGTDDAHINLDDYAAGATSQITGEPDVIIGVTHAPYRRVLAQMAADGVELALAGHTHGGQIGLPGRPLVSNCDLPPTMAKGLHRWADAPGGPSLWLHVTAGVGTSPRFPLRLFSRPEACLIEVTPPC